MIIVLNRRGTEYTNDINIPLESKYWKLENDLGVIKKKNKKEIIIQINQLKTNKKNLTDNQT